MILGDKWKIEEKEPLHVWGKDGSEKIIYPDGTIKWIKKPSHRKTVMKPGTVIKQ